MIIASLDSSLLRFRGELIQQWRASGYEVVAAAPGSGMAGKLEGLGVKYHSIPLRRTGLNPFKDLVLLLRLARLIRCERPGYMFLYTIKPVIYASVAAYLLRNCRVFSMITGLGFVFTGEGGQRGLFLQKLVSHLYRMALRRNEKVFFQNPDDAAELSGSGVVSREKVVMVNGSGVNTGYFYQVPLPEGRPIFLLIARLLKEKGIEEYVQAAEMVQKKHPEARFKLIGWALQGGPSVIGPQQVKKWQEEGVVEIMGETDDVRPYLSEASVYVLPSYREGTPRTVLEAMATGRPIITSDAPGCRETVEENVNGFLVPARDPKALAAAMEQFIKEPKLIKQMGAASRKIAEEKYDVHKVNQVINRAMGLSTKL